MGGRFVDGRLTPREREVARLVALGMTNREIALQIRVKERTVEAHVQNILNKLAAHNRVQIAMWHSAQNSAGPPAVSPPEARIYEARPPALPRAPRAVPSWPLAVLLAAILTLAAVDDSPQPLVVTGQLSPSTGPLAYEAKLAGDGEGFGVRYVLGDPTASAIRFVPGAVEFVVVKPGGNTGNNVALEPQARYYAEVELSVERGSNVEFWMNLSSNGYMTHIGDHLISVQTSTELMQLQYFVQEVGGQPLGPQVPLSGLQGGRKITIGAFVDPPAYVVFLDGKRVIGLQHQPNPARLAPSFAVFAGGDGTGTVRLTALRIYHVA